MTRNAAGARDQSYAGTSAPTRSFDLKKKIASGFYPGRLALGAALCLLALFPLRAPADSRISYTGVSKTDKAFANEIAPGLLRDMELASIVAHRGEDKAVRQFASAVLDQRTKAHGELRALAKKTRLVLPDRPGAHQQMQVNQLQKLSGRALDEQFLHLIAQTDYFHFFGLELSNGALRADPEVQAFAKAQRPIIRDDMKRASKLLKRR